MEPSGKRAKTRRFAPNWRHKVTVPMKTSCRDWDRGFADGGESQNTKSLEQKMKRDLSRRFPKRHSQRVEPKVGEAIRQS